MDNKEYFYLFLNADSCSTNVFYYAYQYYKEATVEERKKFNEKVLSIALKCVSIMRSKNTNNIEEIKPLYKKHGIPESFFIKILAKMYSQAESPEKRANRCFVEAKKVFWNSDIMKKMAKIEGVSFEELTEIIHDYARDVLGLQEDDFRKYKETYKLFQRFIHQSIVFKNSNELATIYYLKYANAEEKKAFEDYVLKIMEQLRKAQNEDDYRQILLDLKWSDYNLYYFSQIIPMDQESKYMILKRLKPYYDYAVFVSFAAGAIRKQAFQLYLSKKEFDFLVVVYAREVLHIENIEEQMQDVRRKSQFARKIYFALDSVIDSFDKDKTKEILIQYQAGVGVIYDYCYAYHSFSRDKSKKKMEDFLITCYHELIQERKNMHLEQFVPVDYDSILKDFVLSDEDSSNFSINKGFSPSYVRHCLKYVKDKDLEAQVREKLHQEVEKRCQETSDLCREVLKCIANGCGNEEVWREFTLVDYFRMFPSANIHQSPLTSTNLSVKEKTTLKIFFKSLKNANRLGKDNILNTTFEFYSLKDENGFPIQGTGKILSVEEKEKVIAYLDMYRIPFYDVVVNLAMKLYVDHSLELDESLQLS